MTLVSVWPVENEEGTGDSEVGDDGNKGTRCSHQRPARAPVLSIDRSHNVWESGRRGTETARVTRPGEMNFTSSLGAPTNW